AAAGVRRHALRIQGAAGAAARAVADEVDRAGEAERLVHVRRDARRADVLGAGVRVVGEIFVVGVDLGPPVAVADDELAVAGDLEVDGRVDRGELDLAGLGDADRPLAVVDDARAVGVDVALHALAGGVADGAAAGVAHAAHRVQRVRGHPARAQLVIAVGGAGR